MRVAVAGAGDTGQAIARALLHSGHEVLLIERRRPAFRPRSVPDAEWMFADACELAALQKAGIDTCDAVIAAAGDDKVNLVFALLCKTEFSVPRVVARINNPNDRGLFTTEWGVDVAVASPDSLVAAVELLVDPGGAVRLLTLHAHVGLIEVPVTAGCAAEGRAASGLDVPDGAAVLAVIRDEHFTAPVVSARLRAGDRLLVLASADAEQDVRRRLTGS